MSLECGECERDLRSGHDETCSRFLSGTTWRHVRTGGLYSIVNVNAKLQAPPSWMSHGESVDMERLVIYRSKEDMSYWVRPYVEFMDGRFVQVPAEDDL